MIRLLTDIVIYLYAVTGVFYCFVLRVPAHHSLIPYFSPYFCLAEKIIKGNLEFSQEKKKSHKKSFFLDFFPRNKKTCRLSFVPFLDIHIRI